jgi:hypothetical protein
MAVLSALIFRNGADIALYDWEVPRLKKVVSPSGNVVQRLRKRDNRLSSWVSWHAPPRSRHYAPLSDAAKYPAGARPSKCIIIISPFLTFIRTVGSAQTKPSAASGCRLSRVHMSPFNRNFRTGSVRNLWGMLSGSTLNSQIRP